jgi:hypothetical protein
VPEGISIGLIDRAFIGIMPYKEGATDVFETALVFTPGYVIPSQLSKVRVTVLVYDSDGETDRRSQSISSEAVNVGPPQTHTEVLEAEVQAEQPTLPRDSTKVPTLDAQSNVTDSFSAAALTVDEVEQIKFEELERAGLGSAYLSPNGSQIAWTNGELLCVFSASGQKQNCVSIKNQIDEGSVMWSPDGKYLAFNELISARLIDSDIWVMDTSSYRLTNLTDDGFDGHIYEAPPTAYLDHSPAWSSDSRWLAFLRSPEAADDRPGSIYAITPDGNTLERVFDQDIPRSAFSLAWSPNGELFAYATHQGVVLARISGQETPEVIRFGDYATVEFSPDGQYVLACEPPLSVYPANCYVAPIDGNNDGFRLQVDSYNPARWAGWAPAGSTLVYIVNNPAQPEIAGLYLVQSPGESGKQVYPSSDMLGPFHTPWRTLTWAENNTILVRNQAFQFLLIHLEAGSVVPSDTVAPTPAPAIKPTCSATSSDLSAELTVGEEGWIIRSEVAGECKYDDLVWVVLFNGTEIIRENGVDRTALRLPIDESGAFTVWLEALYYDGTSHRISNEVTVEVTVEPVQVEIE